ncbi:hypothetical protein EK904_011562 [Melospiza melodia maxima]|nr:hypothetical protein EK904_011562 [Melospiza melodia maxima]
MSLLTLLSCASAVCPSDLQQLWKEVTATQPVEDSIKQEEDRQLSLWGVPWVPWECWSIPAAPPEGPFPSCAALPTKRPPAPTRSTATESASGLAAKPSVRTWGSLSTGIKCTWWRGRSWELIQASQSVCPELGDLVEEEKTGEQAS